MRHPTEDEPDNAWMVLAEVLRGLVKIERCDIPDNLLVWPRHLKHIPMLRERCPGLKLVLDHIANPPIAQGRIDRRLVAGDPESRFSAKDVL